MRDLEQEYKDESGYDVGKIHDIGTTYFSNDYVEWLEKQVKKLNIDDVSKRSELFYNFITWYNATPKINKQKNGMITKNIIDRYLKL